MTDIAFDKEKIQWLYKKWFYKKARYGSDISLGNILKGIIAANIEKETKDLTGQSKEELSRTITKSWKDTFKGIDLSQEVDDDVIDNPESKEVKLILSLYTMESFLCYATNRASRE